MKLMRASFDFENDVITFCHAGVVTQIPLITEGTHEDASLTDEFKTDDDSSWMERNRTTKEKTPRIVRRKNLFSL